MVDLLVVEPSVSVRKTLERLLESHGYSMRGVIRAEDAEQQIRRQRPDLILSEVDLPGGGGLELCRRWQLAGLPVLLMSTAVTEQLERDSQRAGALELLRKPLAEGVLLSRLAHHLKLPVQAASPSLQVTGTLLGSLMTRPGILGTVLLGPHAETLEHLGTHIPESLYLPFLTLAQRVDTDGEQSFMLSDEPVCADPDHTDPVSTNSPSPARALAPSDTAGLPADQVQTVQLDYPGHCLLLFRLPGQTADGPAADELSAAEQSSALRQPSTLVCLIYNSSYASLIKYHLRSSPYIRL